MFCLVVLIYTIYWTIETYGKARRRAYATLSYAVPFEPSATGAPQPVAATPQPVTPVTPVTSKTMEEKIKERCEKPENNFLFQYSKKYNYCYEVNHNYGWFHNKDNVKNMLNNPESFCKEKWFPNDEDTCNEFEDAFKKICEKDHKPYTNENECTLVNLYGTLGSYWLLGMNFKQNLKNLLIKERCKQDKYPYFSEDRCFLIDTYGQYFIAPKWLEDNLKEKVPPFCNSDIKYGGFLAEKTLQSFSFCGDYEEALNKRCDDFKPYYSNKNECILVNLSGVHYDSIVKPHEGNWYKDLQKMDPGEFSELLEKPSFCDHSYFSNMENCADTEKSIREQCDNDHTSYDSKELCALVNLYSQQQSGLDEST